MESPNRFDAIRPDANSRLRILATDFDDSVTTHPGRPRALDDGRDK
jgi:hypothetical protein